MDEFEWSPEEETEPPHIDLHRRLDISGRTYEVSACGGGWDPVAVRVTGRNHGGYVVTQLTGDVLPQDLTDVADLLQATFMGLATANQGGGDWRLRSVDWRTRLGMPEP